MSLSSANLSGVLIASGKLSAGDAARLRNTFERRYTGAHRPMILEAGTKFVPAPTDDDLYSVICRAQDRFKAPHRRWDWCHRMPFPFRWGPNGAFFLLLAMLGAYALIVAALHWSAA